jgi:hypothetical protein
MAITQAMATSFKRELMQALHNFNNPGGNTFKIALYTSSATLGASTTAYTTTNEVASTGNYVAGGNTLTSVTPTTSGTTAFTDFADTTWSSATITANGALIYNSTNANRAVAVLAFGGDKTSTNGDFTIVFPTADATNAIIRIA